MGNDTSVLFPADGTRYCLLVGDVDIEAGQDCARCGALVPKFRQVDHVNWHASTDTAATTKLATGPRR